MKNSHSFLRTLGNFHCLKIVISTTVGLCVLCCMSLSKPHNKEKLYIKYLETQCSDQWWKHLEIVIGNPPGHARAYIHWHLHNKHTRSLYKLAPYLTHQSSPYQLELLQICTQHTIHIIPSHLHYAFQNPRADYQDRVCPYCLATGTRILGDEVMI